MYEIAERTYHQQLNKAEILREHFLHRFLSSEPWSSDDFPGANSLHRHADCTAGRLGTTHSIFQWIIDVILHAKIVLFFVIFNHHFFPKWKYCNMPIRSFREQSEGLSITNVLHSRQDTASYSSSLTPVCSVFRQLPIISPPPLSIRTDVYNIFKVATK